MNVLGANVVLIISFAIVAGIVCYRSTWRGDLQKWSAVVCVIFSIAGILGVWWVLTSSPGFEETVKQENEQIINDESENKDLINKPDHVKILVQRLMLAWDADANADWPVAETMATLCQIAYQPPVDAEDAYQKLGFEQVKTFTDASLIGYVLFIENTSIAVFRGTDDKADWAYNLNNFTTPTSQGPIHRGFHQAYMPLKPQIDKILARQKPKRVWITGHSLGGALAVVCAQDLIQNPQLSVHGMMTFGQPMVATRQLAANLNIGLQGRYVHYVNETDIVPRVHPSLKHCGSLVWFTQGEIRRTKPKMAALGAQSPDPSDSEDVLPPLSREEFEQVQKEMRRKFESDVAAEGPLGADRRHVAAGNFPFIDDHSMDLYLEKIRSANAPTGASLPSSLNFGN